MKSELTLGIMQPYLFPYIGYFDLINRTDQWVVFDLVQYNSKSWMNRNRVLHPVKGWQYITAPVSKCSLGTLIKDVFIKDMEAVEQKIMGQLQHYKKSAPYANVVYELIAEVFSTASSSRLIDLNISAMKVVCDYLGIKFDYLIASKLGFELPEIKHPGQWALEISSSLNADCYLNPIGGRGIFIPNEFHERKIKLEFLDTPDIIYDCGKYVFEKNLSIIDVLMWNSPDDLSCFFNLNNGNKYI